MAAMTTKNYGRDCDGEYFKVLKSLSKATMVHIVMRAFFWLRIHKHLSGSRRMSDDVLSGA